MQNMNGCFRGDGSVTLADNVPASERRLPDRLPWPAAATLLAAFCALVWAPLLALVL